MEEKFWGKCEEKEAFNDEGDCPRGRENTNPGDAGKPPGEELPRKKRNTCDKERFPGRTRKRT